MPRSFYLLTALLFLFITPVLDRLLPISEISFNGVLILILITGLYVVSRKRSTLYIALAFALPTLVASATSLVTTSPALQVSVKILSILFLIFMFVTVVNYVFEGKKVSFDKILGAVCLYLLLGFIWGITYQLVEKFAPGSFSISPALQGTTGDKLPLLVYYSFVTLTTLGFGDITPIGSVARTLSTLQAVTGVVFMAAFVGRLVGLHKD